MPFITGAAPLGNMFGTGPVFPYFVTGACIIFSTVITVFVDAIIDKFLC
jgi:hypothetical protein